uniref:Centrosomal protein of 97 kDa n=1 Tax=Strigamia maritima TaxID=126957 RepID=T1J4N6_STRMM
MAEKVEEESGILYLNNRNLKKLDKNDGLTPQTLVLDGNLLQRLDNLSAADNELVRMYGVSKLINLRILDLSQNNIVCVEGLKELPHLQWLNLAGNNIKAIDHLNTNSILEHLDLSDNNITHLSDISFLKVLTTLLLHKNKITTLRFASNYLSSSINILTLSENILTDINEVSYLSGLSSLEQLSIADNPCYRMTGENIGYDYRPFIINWCLRLRILDGYLVGPKESLKAEWLYSQGKGRHFRPGEHERVVAYLSQVCPLTGADDLQTEEDAKLSHILNKQKQHQMQLLEELSRPFHPSSSPMAIRSASARIEQSPSPSLRRKGFRNTSPRSIGGSPRDGRSSLSNSWSNKYSVELPAGLYVLDDQIRNDSEMTQSDTEYNRRPQSLFTKKSSSLTSDIMVQSFPGDSSRTLDSLTSETHYVPVPESMLSPDFRPLTTSPPQVYDIYNGDRSRPQSAKEYSRPRRIKYAPKSAINLSPSPSARGPSPNTSRSPVRPGTLSRSPTSQSYAANFTRSSSQGSAANFSRSSSGSAANFSRSPSQGSAINLSKSPSQGSFGSRGFPTVSLHPLNSKTSPVRPQQPERRLTEAFLNQRKGNIATNSPLLHRTAALRQLTKHKLMSSVAKKRHNLVEKIINLDTTSSADTSVSETESTDSEMSLSKLALVKEIASKRRSRIAPSKMVKEIIVTEKENVEMSEKKQNVELLKETAEELKIDLKNTETEKNAAVLIQAAWKGFHTRERDPLVKKMKDELRHRRTEEHIGQLTTELNKTRQELQHERQLRTLQIDTIRALWKEVQLLQKINTESKTSTCVNTRGNSLNDLSITSPIYQTDINQLFAARMAKSGTAEATRGSSEPPSSMQQIPKIMSQSMPAYPDEKNSEHTNVMVNQLAKTCEDLTNQVQHLHEALQVMSRIVFSPGSHQCNPMTRSVSSDISACSCPTWLNNLISQQMESLEMAGPASQSMVSSVMSTDSNADVEGLYHPLKFSPEMDEGSEESKSDVSDASKKKNPNETNRTASLVANNKCAISKNRHENLLQCGDAAFNNNNQTTPSEEDDCVITVQVLQAQVIEIQEVKQSPKTPEAPPVNHSGQGDDVNQD